MYARMGSGSRCTLAALAAACMLGGDAHGVCVLASAVPARPRAYMHARARACVRACSDIKTQNIFVSGGGLLKLGDFGVSKVRC